MSHYFLATNIFVPVACELQLFYSSIAVVNTALLVTCFMSLTTSSFMFKRDSGGPSLTHASIK